MKDRYWINRFESRIDKFSVDELMKKIKNQMRSCIEGYTKI